jgi:cell division protein FtsL
VSARAAAGHASLPRAPGGRIPRRVSGSAPRPAPGRAPRALRLVHGLARGRLLDRLLRVRLVIAIVGVLLTGIVFTQVSLLKLNSSIGRAVESASTLQRQNAALGASVSRLSSGERIQAAARRLGMVMPSASQLRFVQVRPERDPGKAIRTLRNPKAQPPAPAPAPVVQAPTTTTTTTPTTAAPTRTTTTAPTTTAPTTTTPTTTTPATTTPAQTTAPAAGGAAAPATTGQG